MCVCTYIHIQGTSLVVQWLRLLTPKAGAWVPSLVKELRSRRLHGTA